MESWGQTKAESYRHSSDSLKSCRSGNHLPIDGCHRDFNEQVTKMITCLGTEQKLYKPGVVLVNPFFFSSPAHIILLITPKVLFHCRFVDYI